MRFVGAGVGGKGEIIRPNLQTHRLPASGELLAQEFHDPGLRATDDGFVAFYENGALEELLVLHEDLDNGFWVVDEVVGIEFQLFKFGILADEVFDRVPQSVHDPGEGGLIGRGFDVKDDFVIDSQFLGDRQGVLRRSSMIVVIDGDLGHGREISSPGGRSRHRRKGEAVSGFEIEFFSEAVAVALDTQAALGNEAGLTLKARVDLGGVTLSFRHKSSALGTRSE